MTWIRCSLMMFCSLSLLGCGGGAPDKPEFIKNLVPVTGKVTWKGDPLAGATVRFLVATEGQAGEPAEATTDDSGNFTLQTMIANASLEDRQGALPGAYKVVISKIVRPDGSAIPPSTTEADALAEGAKQLLPPKYSDYEKTTLRETVKSEATEVNFELKP